jgi:hypothetical protein
VAARVRDILADQTTWSGSASDLLRIGADPAGNGGSPRDPSWPKTPRALAGCLRLAQTALRTLGIEIAFGREGRAGTRVIRMSASHQYEPHETVSIVSTVSPFISSAPSVPSFPPTVPTPHIRQRMGRARDKPADDDDGMAPGPSGEAHGALRLPRAWPISPYGQLPAKPRSGRPALSCAPTRPIAGAAIETVIEADPVAACVRDIVAMQTTWSGNASDLLRVGSDPAGNGGSPRDPSWPKTPRALAGRLRRAQTALRTLGIEIAFGREGRAGTRVIRSAPSVPSFPPTAPTLHIRQRMGSACDKPADDADGAGPPRYRRCVCPRMPVSAGCFVACGGDRRGRSVRRPPRWWK